MSLTQQDLQEIRSIVQASVNPLIHPLDGELSLLRNDIQKLTVLLRNLV